MSLRQSVNHLRDQNQLLNHNQSQQVLRQNNQNSQELFQYSQTPSSSLFITGNQEVEEIEIKTENNSIYHMIIHCLSLFKINFQSDSQFPALKYLSQLIPKSQTKQNPYTINNLNNCLQNFFQNEQQKQDSILIFKAIISQSKHQSSKQRQISSSLFSCQENKDVKHSSLFPQIIQSKYKKDLECWEQQGSEFSNLFRSLKFNGYWCESCEKPELAKEEGELFINIKKYYSNLKSIQEYFPLFQNNTTQQFNKCKNIFCNRKVEYINGFIRLPQFLFIYLDEPLVSNVKISNEIQVCNQILKKNIPYSLKGGIDQAKRYWKRENGIWNIAYFENQIDQNPNKNKFIPQGLLYVQEQIKVEQKGQQQQQYKIPQFVDIHLKEMGFYQLKLIDQRKYFTQLEGIKQKNEKFSISVFSFPDYQKSKYQEILLKIEKLNSKHIMKYVKTTYLEKSNSFFIFTFLQNLLQLNSCLHINQYDNESRADILQQLTEFIKQIEINKLSLQPLQLSHIWINSYNKLSILPSQFFPIDLSTFQLSYEWKNDLFSKFVQVQNDRSSQPTKNQKLNLSTIHTPEYFSSFKRNEIQSARASRNIEPQFRSNRVLIREVMPVSNLDKIAYDFVVQNKECAAKYDDVQESLPFLKIIGYEIKQYVGASSTRLTLQAEKQNKKYSVKLIPIVSIYDLQDKEYEASLMRYVHSQYVVGIHESFIDPEQQIHFFIITDYYTGGSLDKYLQNNNMDEKKIIKLFRGILQGIQDCHDLNIIHGSIRPENILLEKDEPLISNFTTATMLEKDQHEVSKKGCNKDFEPLETIQDDCKISFKTEYFSLGMILYTLCEYNKDHNQALINEVLNMKKGKFPDFSKRKYNNLLEIAKQMMAQDPKKRMNIKEAFSSLDQIEENLKK